MIQKLSSISQELAKDKYSNVQIRIAHKYDEIERLMLEEFVRAHRQGNWRRMHEIAAILADFKVRTIGMYCYYTKVVICFQELANFLKQIFTLFCIGHYFMWYWLKHFLFLIRQKRYQN